MSIKKNQSGFSVFEGLTILLILGLIAGAGWYVVQKQRTRTTPTSNNSNVTEQKNKSADYAGDITSKLKIKPIQLSGAGTQGLDVDPETGYVYTGHNGSVISKCAPGGVQQKPGRNTISVVDPAKSKELALEAADSGPIWPAVDPKRNVVYLANSGGGGTISIHAKATGKKLESIKVGGLPHMPGVLDNIMVVSNTNDQSQTYYGVINLETKKVSAHHKSPRLPHPVVIDAEAKLGYMMGVEDGEVVVIDMTNGQPKETFKLDGAAGQLAMSKKLGKFVASSSKHGTAMVIFDIDTKKQLATIGFEGVNVPGTSVIIDEEASIVFVVMADQNTIGVASLDSLKPLGYFKVGECPYAVRLDVKRGKGYVTNSGDSTLSVFDLKEVRLATGQ